MIQLVFDARDAAAGARNHDPVQIGYSAHEGATSSAWDDDKLEVVDSRPVVYPAAGSHANKYGAALWLGSSADAGVGCDDTRGPHRELSPRVETIPSDPAAAQCGVSVDRVRGPLGRAAEGVLQRPDRPEPEDAVDDSRSRGRTAGATAATPCPPVDSSEPARPTSSARLSQRGSSALIRAPAQPGTDAHPPRKHPRARDLRRGASDLDAGRAGSRSGGGARGGRSSPPRPACTSRRPTLFLGLGLLLIPIAFAITLLQWLLLEGIDLVGVVTGEAAGSWAFVAAIIGADAHGLGSRPGAGSDGVRARRDRQRPPDRAGRRVPPRLATHSAARRCDRPLRRGVDRADGDRLPDPGRGLAPHPLVHLAAPVVVLEDRNAYGSLRRSGALVRSRWIKVGSLVGLSGVIALGLGPLVGALLIFLTEAPLATLNLVAGVVYALAMPFVALVTSYVYFDARTRFELEPVERVVRASGRDPARGDDLGQLGLERPVAGDQVGELARRPRSAPRRSRARRCAPGRERRSGPRLARSRADARSRSSSVPRRAARAPPGRAAPSACRATRSPRRGRARAGFAGSCARSPCAASRRPRSGSRAPRPSCRSRRAASR